VTLIDDTPESLAWQVERDLAAQAHLEAAPARELWRDLVGQQLVDVRRTPLLRRGDAWFQRIVLRPEDEHPAVVVRRSPTGEPRVLVDVDALGEKRGAAVSLMSFSPSPDGTLLAYVVEQAGTERGELFVLDVETGSLLTDELPWSVWGNVAWLPDSSGFWLAARDFTDGFRMPLYRYELGGPLPQELPVTTDDPFVVPTVSEDGLVALVTGNTEMRVDQVVLDGEVRPLLAGVPGSHLVRFVGEDAYAIVEDGAPRGRLVRFPVATAQDRSTWTELVAEGTDVLRWLEVVGDRLVVGYLRDASSGLRVLDLDGAVVDEVPLPGRGSVCSVAVGAAHPGLPMFVVGDGEVSFVYSTFEQSPAVYRYVVAEQRLELVQAPAVVVEGLSVSLVWARSSDGVEVPAHVVHRADLDLTVPRPTLLYGYGGYNLAQLPSYGHESAAWVQAGGIYVLAHLRGGSEFGRDWWHGGRRENKQRTFDDLYAVAERLVELGWTSREKLVAKGESNGGLLTGAAVVQRPELWAAVVSDVPIYDLLHYDRDPLTYAIGRVEYGDPHVPEEAAWLRAVSPAENVGPASYPPLLVTVGANDPRCPVWHGRVLVDLLEKAQQGEAPILLRVYAGQGHGAAGLASTAGKSADWMAFAAAASGLVLG
jgi:prolyl oligopeptidase